MMQEKTARLLSELFLRHGGEQNNILEDIKHNETEQEFIRIKKMIGAIMGTIYFEALSPIFEEYPNIRPAWLTSPDRTG